MSSLRATCAQRPVCGPWVSLPGSLSAELLGGVGFDFVVVDLQHGGVTWDGLVATIQAFELGGTPVLVRVPHNDDASICRALDLGAAGVIVPMVGDDQEARAAAQAARYPPEGIRSFGQLRASMTSETANRRVLCLVMIETRAGLDNIEAIAATPGIDGVMLGPFDLALALGVAPDVLITPELADAVDQVVAACIRHDLIAAGVPAGDGSPEELLKRGVRLLAAGSDRRFLLAGAEQHVTRARKWTGAVALAK